MPSTNGSSVVKVFLLPELVEQILLHLDMIELFRVQGVNRTFQSIISSKTFRQRMFLIEDPAVHLEGPIESIVNPLLLNQRLGLRALDFYFDGRLHTSRPEGEHDLEILAKVKDLDRLEHHGSWRETKLLRRSCGIRRVCIVAEPEGEDRAADIDYQALGLLGQILQVWFMDLEDGATLGQVVDAISTTVKTERTDIWSHGLEIRREQLVEQKAKCLKKVA